MNFWRKLRETILCMIPIILIVIIIYTFFFKFDAELLMKFLFSCLLIAVGEVLFLTGIENSIMPMGEFVGNSSGALKHTFILIIFAFIFGAFATIAEPDLQVLASEAMVLGIPITKTAFMFLVGAGVGLFVAVSLIRILKSISYKALVMTILIVCFLIATFLPDSLIALSFDAGGATTGIVTAPFLLAITAGISRNRSSKSHSDNFGVIGITSLGPILAMLVLSLFAGLGGKVSVDENSIHILLDTLINSLIAIIPLVMVFFIFEALFIKLPKKKKTALLFGAFVTFTGLYLFLFGIDFGFLKTSEVIGEYLSGSSSVIFLVLCMILGFSICFTEPAVRVLSVQVEDITQGNISRRGVLIAIAIAMMLAVLLAGIKIIFNIPTFYILAIGYFIVIVLMIFTPKTFAAVAFDSGGVASGPMTSAFVLPLMIGFASGLGSVGEGFGLIAIVSMLPILVIELLGVIYKIKLSAHEKQSYRVALRIAYGADAYSNMDDLEEEYNNLIARRELENDLKEIEETQTQEPVLD